MLYNEEFEEKIEGYKMPRQKNPPPAEGPFVGPPKTEANKHLFEKKEHKTYKTSNDSFNPNMEPLGQRDFDKSRVTKVDPLALGEAITYKEARGHRQSGLNLFLAQFEGDLPKELIEKMTNFYCILCAVSFLQGIIKYAQFSCIFAQFSSIIFLRR